MSDDQTEILRHLWDRRSLIIYRCRLSSLYHQKRERFFDILDKTSAALITVAATSAVGAILKGNASWELGIAASTAVLSMIPLVVSPALKARHHAILAAEFRRLLAECEHEGERWDELLCSKMAGRTVEIEAAERAPLAGVVADCQNQLAISRGEKPVAILRWYHQLLKHWVDMRPDPARHDQTGPNAIDRGTLESTSARAQSV